VRNTIPNTQIFTSRIVVATRRDLRQIGGYSQVTGMIAGHGG